MPRQAYHGVVHARNQYGARVFLVAGGYEPLLRQLQAGLAAAQKQAVPAH
jgi:hypothetical protein